MLIDLGRKSEGPSEVSAAPSKSEKYYPSVYIGNLAAKINPDDIPLDKDLEVKAVIRVTGLSTRKTGGDKSTSIDIEIRKIDFGGDNEGASLQDAIEEGLSDD